jgi:hypothetical protein
MNPKATMNKMKMTVQDLLPLLLVDNHIILRLDQGHDSSRNTSIIVKKRKEGRPRRNIDNPREVIALSLQNEKVKIKDITSPLEDTTTEVHPQEGIVPSLQSEKVKDIMSPLEGTTTEVHPQTGIVPSLQNEKVKDIIVLGPQDEIDPILPEGMSERVDPYRQEEIQGQAVPNHQEEIATNRGKDQIPQNQDIENQKVIAKYPWEEKRIIVDTIRGTKKTIKKRIGNHHLRGHRYKNHRPIRGEVVAAAENHVLPEISSNQHLQQRMHLKDHGLQLIWPYLITKRNPLVIQADTM